MSDLLKVINLSEVIDLSAELTLDFSSLPHTLSIAPTVSAISTVNQQEAHELAKSMLSAKLLQQPQSYYTYGLLPPKSTPKVKTKALESCLEDTQKKITAIQENMTKTQTHIEILKTKLTEKKEHSNTIEKELPELGQSILSEQNKIRQLNNEIKALEPKLESALTKIYYTVKYANIIDFTLIKKELDVSKDSTETIVLNKAHYVNHVDLHAAASALLQKKPLTLPGQDQLKTLYTHLQATQLSLEVSENSASLNVTEKPLPTTLTIDSIKQAIGIIGLGSMMDGPKVIKLMKVMAGSLCLAAAIPIKYSSDSFSALYKIYENLTDQVSIEQKNAMSAYKENRLQFDAQLKEITDFINNSKMIQDGTKSLHELNQQIQKNLISFNACKNNQNQQNVLKSLEKFTEEVFNSAQKESAAKEYLKYHEIYSKNTPEEMNTAKLIDIKKQEIVKIYEHIKKMHEYPQSLAADKEKQAILQEEIDSQTALQLEHHDALGLQKAISALLTQEIINTSITEPLSSLPLNGTDIPILSYPIHDEL